MTAPQKVLQPWDDAHFKQFGLKRNVIEPWEDGLRTQLDKAGYEWWYFDTHMDDGTQIVVVFYTKSMIAAKGPLTPFATIEITYPDGRKTEERVDATPSQCRFSTDGCDVKIGPCTVTGDLTNYHIHFQSKNVTAELDLHGTVPSWRPGVGGTLYGDDEAKQFFWLPSVPSGAVRAVVSDHGTTKTYNGSGYHDHNWGNVSIANLVHHWYWGRAQIGPYMIISAWLTAEKQFGFAETPVFMLTKNGKLITGNEDGGLRFTATDKSTDPNTGKPFSATLVYEWESPEGQYFITATAKLLEDYDRIEKKCRVMAAESRNSVCIDIVMTSHSLWDDIFYESMSQWELRHPDLPVPRFCHQTSATIETSVTSGMADMGVVFREPANLPDNFVCELLAEMPLAVYFTNNSPLVSLETVSFDDLSDKYLVCPTNPQLQTMFDGAVDTFRRNGLEPNYRLRDYEDFHRIAYLLGDDEIVFGNAMPNTKVIGRLHGRPLVGENTTYPVYLLYNASSSKPAVKLFADICFDVAAHWDASQAL